MLDAAGRFEFSGEILDLVERLWAGHREATGGADARVERLAALVYIVAALRQDVEGIWSLLAAAPQLQGTEWVQLLEQELGTPGPERAAALKAELQRRGWLV